jgi:flagellar basal-body rod modification protein FlgD
LSTLVSLQQSAQTSQALSLVGATVVVNGSTAQLANGKATWALNATQPATATITITAPSGATV